MIEIGPNLLIVLNLPLVVVGVCGALWIIYR